MSIIGLMLGVKAYSIIGALKSIMCVSLAMIVALIDC